MMCGWRFGGKAATRPKNYIFKVNLKFYVSYALLQIWEFK